MKPLFYLAFLITSVCTFSQSASSDSLKVNLQPTAENGFLSQEIVIPIVSIDTSKTASVDIKADHWDTGNFNPYRNEIVKFPFQITFKELQYSCLL